MVNDEDDVLKRYFFWTNEAEGSVQNDEEMNIYGPYRSCGACGGGCA